MKNNVKLIYMQLVKMSQLLEKIKFIKYQLKFKKEKYY